MWVLHDSESSLTRCTEIHFRLALQADQKNITCAFADKWGLLACGVEQFVHIELAVVTCPVVCNCLATSYVTDFLSMSSVVDDEAIKIALAACRRTADTRRKKEKRLLKKKVGAKYVSPARQLGGGSYKLSVLSEKRRLLRETRAKYAREKYAMKMGITESELLAVLESDSADVGAIFGDSEKDLTKALLLYYVNSGYLAFDNHREYMQSYKDCLVDEERLSDQIAAKCLTDGELDCIVKRFFTRHSYTEANLYACAACGYRVREQKCNPEVLYRRVGLYSDVLSKLRLCTLDAEAFCSEQTSSGLSPLVVPVSADFDLGELCPWKSRSIYEAPNGELFHLHPELVESGDDDGVFVRVCPYCFDSIVKKKIPKLSLAAGVDFGSFKRVGLEEPNLHEELVIAKTRLVISSLKIKSNMAGRVSLDRDVIQCNAVLFTQDNVEDVGRMLSGEEMFDEKGLVSLLRIFLLDDKGDLDRLARSAFGRTDLLARPWVVCQWILFLSQVHSAYMGEAFPSVREIACRIDKTNELIKSRAARVDVRAVLDFENQIGSDVAGAQSAELPRDVRFGEDEYTDGSDHLALRVSCVIPNPTRVLEDNEIRDYAYLSAIDKNINNRSKRPLPSSSALESSDECSEDGEMSSEDSDDEFRREDESDSELPARDTPYGGIDVDGLRDTFGSEFERVEHDDMDHVGRGVRHAADPINEFVESEYTVCAAFPTVFLFGHSYGIPFGKLNSRQQDHLLHQYTRIPSRCRRLLLYLFDSMMRYRSIIGVNAHVQNSQAAVKAIRNLSENKEERKLLAKAKEFPKSTLAKKFLQKYSPHFEFSGLNISHGSFEEKNEGTSDGIV
jgi:hypothetical protein